MLALDGIMVLDLSRRYPGAYSTMFLADFGATVIKVDAPGSEFIAPGVDTAGEAFPAHFPLDRNKQSVSINLKSEAGREVFLRLVQRADILVEGFRPGVMDRLGVGYARLSELNPRLIYCAQSGYGQNGPYVDLAGHDWNYCAVGGVQSLIGEPDGPPRLTSNFLADMAGAGLHGTIGILIAVLARERTGRGQYIDISYLDGVISLLALESPLYFLTGKVPRRGHTYTTGQMPWAHCYQCRDGEYFSVGAMEAHLWANLCRALGREDFVPHQFDEPPKRDEIFAAFRETFLTRTRDEWWEFFKDKNTCVGPVLNLDETFKDPQVLARQMVVEMEHPTVGNVRQIGIPIKLSDTPGQIRRLGVVVGSDGDAVFADLGYAPDEIARLRADGALG